MSSLHIAFVKSPIREKILAREKTCESRLSVNLHPARHVEIGDQLLFKCGPAFAIARVTQVDVYRDLRADDIAVLRDTYLQIVSGDNPDLSYWDAKVRSRHAVFLHFDHLRLLHVAPHELPSVMLGWVQDYHPSEKLDAYLQSITRTGVPSPLPTPLPGLHTPTLLLAG